MSISLKSPTTEVNNRGNKNAFTQLPAVSATFFPRKILLSIPQYSTLDPSNAYIGGIGGEAGSWSRHTHRYAYNNLELNPPPLEESRLQEGGASRGCVRKEFGGLGVGTPTIFFWYDLPSLSFIAVCRNAWLPHSLGLQSRLSLLQYYYYQTMVRNRASRFYFDL